VPGYSEKFLQAVEHTLKFEGGYVNDPHDPGGETKFGISARSFPGVNIRKLTRERAIELYHERFWEPGGYDLIDDVRVAAKAFDLAVNMGPRKAHELLQKAVNDVCGAGTVVVDGVLGPKTRAAANACSDQAVLLRAVIARAILHYQTLRGWPRYGRGWERRAKACVTLTDVV